MNKKYRFIGFFLFIVFLIYIYFHFTSRFMNGNIYFEDIFASDYMEKQMILVIKDKNNDSRSLKVFSNKNRPILIKNNCKEKDSQNIVCLNYGVDSKGDKYDFSFLYNKIIDDGYWIACKSIDNENIICAMQNLKHPLICQGESFLQFKESEWKLLFYEIRLTKNNFIVKELDNQQLKVLDLLNWSEKQKINAEQKVMCNSI